MLSVKGPKRKPHIQLGKGFCIQSVHFYISYVGTDLGGGGGVSMVNISIGMCRWNRCTFLLRCVFNWTMLLFQQDTTMSLTELCCVFSWSMLLFQQDTTISLTELRCVFSWTMLLFQQDTTMSLTDLRCVFSWTMLLFQQDTTMYLTEMCCIFSWPTLLPQQDPGTRATLYLQLEHACFNWIPKCF